VSTNVLKNVMLRIVIIVSWVNLINVKQQVLATTLMSKKQLVNVLLIVTDALTELFVRFVITNLYSIKTYVLLLVLSPWILFKEMVIKNVFVRMNLKLWVTHVLLVVKVVLCVTLMLNVNIVKLDYGWLVMELV